MWENIEIFNLEISYYKDFYRKFVSKRIEKKTEILMNNPVCLGLSILELSKILMYEFFYDHVKQKYGGKTKLYYMNRDNLIVYINTDDIYEDIAEDVENRFDTTNYGLDRPFPKWKNKYVTGLMKDELGGKSWQEQKLIVIQ